MHGCSDACLVYGFNMGDSRYVFDNYYLNKDYPNVSEFAKNVVRNYLCEAVYGISCEIDKETGQAIIRDEEKEQVKKLYEKYVEYLREELSEKNFAIKISKIQLCFHLVVSGDYERCHELIPTREFDGDIEVDESDDDDKDNDKGNEKYLDNILWSNLW